MQGHHELTEKEQVTLEVIEVLGGDASYMLIKTMIREQFRKELRAAIHGLLQRGLLLRYSLGVYSLTRRGGLALADARSELAA